MAEITIASGPTPSEAPVEIATRPDHIPEKFWDADTGSVKTDDLIKSYSALESKLGTPKEDETTTEVTEEEVDETTTTDDEKAEEVITEAGLDVDAIEAHWLEHGSVPDEELAKLAKVGVTKEMAEEFITYRQGQADRIREEMLGTVGGQDAVDKMVEWAGTTYTAEKAEAFNKAVNSKDRGQIEMALKALKADFEKVNGKVPKLVKPTGSAVPKGDRYESLDQMLADQRNPKYATDPAFRQKVIEKLSRSDI